MGRPVKVKATYEHTDAGPVLIEAVLDGAYSTFNIPRAEIPAIIDGLRRLVEPKVEAIGTPIPTDAEVAATIPSKPRSGWLGRIMGG